MTFYLKRAEEPRYLRSVDEREIDYAYERVSAHPFETREEAKEARALALRVFGVELTRVVVGA